MQLEVVLFVVYFSLMGAGLGAVSGLIPGIHVNTLALILVSSYASIVSFSHLFTGGMDERYLPLLVAATIVSAAVVHSFMDFIPSIFLGAPDDSTAISVLPSHRLLLAGEGMRAVHSAAMGSLVGACFTVLIAIPVQWLMGAPVDLYLHLSPFIPYLLAGVALLLIFSQKGQGAMGAMIDLQDGGLEKCEEVVSLRVPRPIEGERADLSGEIRRGLIFYYLHTRYGDWRLINAGAVSEGWHRASGKWKVIQQRWRAKAWAALVLLLSGVLGFVVMNGEIPFSDLYVGLDESVLFPLLTGLFGMPILIHALSSKEVPEQVVDIEYEPDVFSALKGVVPGGLVGWFPGITSTAGTVVASLLTDDEHDSLDAAERFITVVSAVGTSAAVFSLIALSVIGKGRTGAMLALLDVVGTEGLWALSRQPSAYLSLLLLSVLISSLLGYKMMLCSGRLFARWVERIDVRMFTVGIIIFLVILVIVFNGVPGIIILSVATLLGAVPPAIGISRVHLTGCLLVPLILFFTGWDRVLISLLSM